MGVPILHMQPRSPDFLDLPWDLTVSAWPDELLIDMPTGVHRHPVVFVERAGEIYAIKELPLTLARNEYRVLDALTEATSRAAEPVGLAERYWLDPHEEAAGAVITRYVRHAFPYRRLVTGGSFGPRRNQLLDAMAGLLVELHLAGCYWGDCSLSNVLCRYDAGAIEAIMIDAETSRLYPSLSDGQRLEDVEIMTDNLAGDMADVAAMSGVDLDEADLALGEDVAARYAALWEELFAELVITRNEGYRIRQRISRLNDLGFFVGDIDLEPSDGGEVVRMRARVGSRTYNSDRLRELTGIDASENQAKIILGDVSYFLAKNGYATPEGRSAGTLRWLVESFDPMVARIREAWHGDDPVQGYCDFLHHRLTTATARGSDIDNLDAYVSWAAAGFPGFPA
ncbi:MAG: DUF4032 domain-containing protein [Actinobacteria bacterium]|nr:DUF4032 domain-containing protein [Actinomycetota bacterium]MCI0678322.1 DUF4032 domain-containing protein [Actinomycetota bacterium]